MPEIELIDEAKLRNPDGSYSWQRVDDAVPVGEKKKHHSACSNQNPLQEWKDYLVSRRKKSKKTSR